MSDPDRKRQPAYDCVIFDIDNVLVDTRSSYLQTIRWTVELFLTAGRVPLFRAAPKSMRPALLGMKDVEQFKLLGGFNDDWDCCYGILIYLLSLPIKERSILNLKRKAAIKALAKKAVKRPLGVNGIVKMFGRTPFVTIEKISQIFQEVYLGRELIHKIERREPQYWKKLGLIGRERLIFRKSTLQHIRQMGVRLGIATGRPAFEAKYALKHFGILDYFDAITTMDEIKKAERAKRCSLRKPHPYSLVETARKMGNYRRFLYLGDLPDDVLAANRAKAYVNISSAAFPYLAARPEDALREIQSVKPDYILKKPSDLTIILKKKR